MMLRFAGREADNYQLTPEQLAEVELARREAKEGLFATDEEMRRRDEKNCGGRADQGGVIRPPRETLDTAGYALSGRDRNRASSTTK
jgi:hypothetical protein